MGSKRGLFMGLCFLALALCLGGALVFLAKRGPLFSRRAASSFARSLEEYDAALKPAAPPSPRRLNALLDRLEKKALDTENMLSVLKRRRAAYKAGTDDDEAGYRRKYTEAARRARKLYPYSGHIAALAAEALLLESSGQAPLNEEQTEELRGDISLMRQGPLEDLALAFSVYSGGMDDPAQARFLPLELFPLLVSSAQGEDREAYQVNFCIRVLLDGRTGEAEAMINQLFDPPQGITDEPAATSDKTIRFGGEFFYDHGNFLRAAEMFALLPDNRSLARQGDALWLAGFADSARNFWALSLEAPSVPLFAAPETRILPQASSQTDGENAVDTRSRALYNLAATVPAAQGAGEQRRFLERFFAADFIAPGIRPFGIVRYSRLFPLDRALYVLDNADKDAFSGGLFELEALRRRREIWSRDRAIAETWLLINKYRDDERLYEWAAWYFEFQRRYEEAAVLLRSAGLNGVEGPWAGLYRALAHIRSGAYNEAEKILRNIAGLWQARANEGLLQEIRAAPVEALQNYEAAAGILAAAIMHGSENAGAALTAGNLSPETRSALHDASRIQLYIARCLKAAGRGGEIRRVLEYALELDPENLEARLEITRETLPYKPL